MEGMRARTEAWRGLAGRFCQPGTFLFDQQKIDEGVLEVRHKLPYSDLTSISKSEQRAYILAGEALEFGHTLTEQIGGQLDAGFILTGFYEDRWTISRQGLYRHLYCLTCSKTEQFSIKSCRDFCHIGKLDYNLLNCQWYSSPISQCGR